MVLQKQLYSCNKDTEDANPVELHKVPWKNILHPEHILDSVIKLGIMAVFYLL